METDISSAQSCLLLVINVMIDMFVHQSLSFLKVDSIIMIHIIMDGHMAKNAHFVCNI